MAEHDSKYDPLGHRLEAVSGDELILTLDELASLVGPLPAEASRNQFWANVVDHHDARRRQWLDRGFKAFYKRSERTVRFVRASADSEEDRTDTPWTDGELRACVEAYRTLWDAERQGRRLNKSALRRETLASGMSGRVKGSYEFRMQNISALLDELGLPFVAGYLPRRNVGGLKLRLVAIINDVWNRTDQPETPTADVSALDTRVAAALDKARRGATLKAPTGSIDVRRANAVGTRFIRDPEVIAWVLIRAGNRCEACESLAPFMRADATPYLEVHHLRPLGEGGPDIVANAIAACPNCHRELHLGADRVALRRAILKRIPALKNFPKREVVAVTGDGV